MGSISFDPQDPLPESNWLWRRVFVFVVTGAILWMLWGAINRLGASALVNPTRGVDALMTLCKWLIGFDAMIATYYMVAPSAEQITKAIQIAKSWRHGVEVGAVREVPPKAVVEIPSVPVESPLVPDPGFAPSVATPPAPARPAQAGTAIIE